MANLAEVPTRVKDPVAGRDGAWFTPHVPSPADDGPRARIPASTRALRLLVVALLVVAAGMTLAGLPWLRAGVAAGRLPRGLVAIPPILLGAFIFGYAVYRLLLVRAGRYPAGKVLAQVGLMLLALGVVAGVALDLVPPGTRRDRIEQGVKSASPEVRALAAELARHRPPRRARDLVPALIELLEDGDPEVRREAHASLVAITGVDLGEDPGSRERWRERFAEHSRDER